MAKVLQNIKFANSFVFEKGGLRVMGVQGLMYPVPFLSLLYELGCELGTKEKVDDVIFLAGKRQGKNAMEFTANKMGVKSKDVAQVLHFVFGQSEVGGMGLLHIQKVDNDAKKVWIIVDTEYFEPISNVIFGQTTKKTNMFVIQYLCGSINAISSYVFGEPIKVEAKIEADGKYHLHCSPGQNDMSALSEDEQGRINKVLEMYTWKHLML